MAPPPRRVLVVDDEPALAETLREYLVGDGHDAEVALNGRDAVAQFERWRPDVVLLDIVMPGMDGAEVLRRLRALDATVPVIMVTGDADETQAGEMLRAGAFGYVAKPFAFAHLSQVVAAALAHRAGDMPPEARRAP